MTRKISLAIIIAMLFSCISAHAGSASDASAESEYYIRAMELMDVLKTDTKISLAPEDGVTRAEFLYTLMSSLGIDVNEKCETIYYSDMSAEHYANMATIAARDMGIISESESFYPDNYITFTEAVKMCVVANGRDLEAKIKGGYPTGYLTVASEAHLLENLFVADEAPEITACDAMILLYNTLTADMLVQTQYGDEKKYEEIKGVTILSQYHSLAKAEGILNCSTNASVYYLGDSIDKNKIIVGDVSYRYTGNVDRYLGMNVSVYYTNDKNIQTAVYLVPTDNNVVSPDSGDLWLEGDYLNYEPDGSRNVLKYKINKNYSLILNGKASSRTLDSVLGSVSSLRLVSNDSDNAYDVVFADVENYILVSSVDYASKIIYDANSHANSISLDNDDMFYSIYDVSGGEYVDFENIDTGMVLGVCRSEDGLYLRLKIYSESVSGVADEVNNTEGTLVICGSEYKISSYFKTFYGNVSFGTDNSYLLGKNGEIVAIGDSTSEMAWGILVKLAKENTAFGGIKAKIFTENAAMVVMDVREKVMVDRNMMPVDDAMAILAPAETTKRQLIRYSLDKDGKLYRIDTKEPQNPAARPENNHVSDNYDDYDALILHRFGEPDPSASGENPTYSDYPTTSYTYTYKSDPKLFYPKFNIKNARIFVIPSQTHANDDTKYYVKTASVFGDDDSYSDTKLSVYNIDEFGMAQAVVYISDTSGVSAPSSNASSAVIDTITLAIDEEDNPATKIGLLSDGKFKYYFLDSNATVSKTSGKPLCSGDIVRFRTNGNKIVSITVDFDAHPEVMAGNGSVSFNDTNAKLQYQSGLLYSINGSNICIDSTARAFGTGYVYRFKNLRHFTISTSDIVIINMKKKGNSIEFESLQTGSASELRSYKNTGDLSDYVVLRQRYLSPQTLFVYRIVNQ